MLEEENLGKTRTKWIKPPYWQGPAKNRGAWLGAEGDSVFRLNDATADKYGVPRGTEIPFRGGIPDFARFAVPLPNGSPGVFLVPGLKGDHKIDLKLIRDRIAEMAGISRAEVVRWQRMNDVRLHHFEGEIVQSPPNSIHQVHHTGGAAAIRNQ